MSTFWKRLMLLPAGLVLVAAGAFAYFYFRSPATAPPREIRVAMTPDTIARGRYLFEVVADCDGCHSIRDFSRFGGPVLRRAAGQVFPDAMGLPGRISAPNISSDPETGIGSWTDGEKIRAIREGVSRDGHALFPMMPYENYRHMSDSDVEALVAYLNTVPPQRNAVPRSEVAFPVSLLIKSAPQPAGQVGPPADPGTYLVTIAGCADCHTPREKGQPVPGRAFAGGQRFAMDKERVVVTPNLTPDPETGLGKWTDEQFLKRFADYREYAQNGPPAATPASFTLMPWLGYSRLSDAELLAIFGYLKKQAPVVNLVDTHPEAH